MRAQTAASLAALCLCLSAAPACSQSEAATATVVDEAPADVTERIVIVGQRPGPGLWKISKGDHVLWVFGTYGPLPKKMEWRSQQVETVLAQSQEYLPPPTASAKVGFFRGITLLPYAIGLKKNPDGAKLQDLLPPEVYARWLPLKQKYIGSDDGVERERPMFAAEELFRKGLASAGLVTDREVRKTIEALVKKNKIKTTPTQVAVELDDPAQAMQDFKKSSINDVACFSATLERLETDLDFMRKRANAWAIGDLQAIEKMDFADRDAACSGAVMNSSFIKDRVGLQSMPMRMSEAWVAAAEKALANNGSSFAMLPLKEILNPKGFVTALQAKGYQVDKPE